MSPEDQRKRFLALSESIRAGEVLTKEQLEYLQRVLFEMGDDRDPSEALGLKHSSGHSLEKDNARRERSLVIHWMENAILPENEGGLGLTYDQAVQAVFELGRGQWTNPKTKEKYIYKDQDGNMSPPFKTYSDSTIEKIWHSKANKHMRNPVRKDLDIDSPYIFKSSKK